MEILVRMDARLLRRGPTGRIHARRLPPWLVALHPFHQQRNRILGSRHTSQILRRAPGPASGHFYRPILRHHRRADIDMVRVEVIRDVAFGAGPGFERLELGFGLAHVAVEVVEVAEVFCAGAGVGVGGVEALVVFDVDEDVVGAGAVEEVLVLGEELEGGFGDEDVDVSFYCVEGYWVVGWVGGEDCDGVTGGEGVDGGFVGVCVTDRGVWREGSKGDV